MTFRISISCVPVILQQHPLVFMRSQICSFCHNHNQFFSSFMSYYQNFNKSVTVDRGATRGAGTACSFRVHEFTPGFLQGSICSFLSFVDHCLSFYHFLLAIVLSVLRILVSQKLFFVLHYVYIFVLKSWSFAMVYQAGFGV